ncbi:hypothetical protein V8B97DRAFT_2020602 [Scleroderma yunnanense]
MYPVGVKKQFDRIGRIRVLLVGRSNAGKTTLLQCVYSATKLPEVFNTNGERRGYHDIQNELIFRSSPGIIFHDSRGFEAGSEDEVMLVKNFIILKTCGIVPVIVILTKADAMQLEAFSQLRDEGFTLKEARTRAKTLATQLMIDVKTKIESQLGMYKYPPKDYVSLAGMNKHNADCDSLLRCTANALDEIGLQKLVVSTQHANVEHKIEFTVK